MTKPTKQELREAREYAAAVCAAAGEPNRLNSVLSPNRARPRDAVLRWAAMLLYGETLPLHGRLTAIGRAFGRDRTTVRGGLRRLDGIVSEPAHEMNEVINNARNKLKR